MEENNNIVIGIEGLVGAGKTSICKDLLNYVPNSVVLHSSDVYRAVVYKLMQEVKKDPNIDIKKINIKDLIVKFKINIKIENRESVVYFGDEKIDPNDIQSDETSMAVSKVSNVADNSEAYKVVAGIIEGLKKDYNVIFSGRDTVNIYPKLNYHFFITADIDERVKRKLSQYEGKMDFETLKKHIEERDKLQKDSGYYKIYDNTIVVDVTNSKSIEESTKEIIKYIKEV